MAQHPRQPAPLLDCPYVGKSFSSYPWTAPYANLHLLSVILLLHIIVRVWFHLLDNPPNQDAFQQPLLHTWTTFLNSSFVACPFFHILYTAFWIWGLLWVFFLAKIVSQYTCLFSWAAGQTLLVSGVASSNKAIPEWTRPWEDFFGPSESCIQACTDVIIQLGNL